MSIEIIYDMLQDPNLSDLQCLTQGRAISFLEVLIPPELQTAVGLTQLLSDCYVIALLERREVGRPSVVTITMKVKTSRNGDQKEDLVNNIPTDITLVYHVQGVLPEPHRMAPDIATLKETKSQLPALIIKSEVKGEAASESHIPYTKSAEFGLASETNVKDNEEADDQTPNVCDSNIKDEGKIHDEGVTLGGVGMERRGESGTVTAGPDIGKVEDGDEAHAAAIEQRVHGLSSKSASRDLVKKLPHLFVPRKGGVLHHGGRKQESIMRTHMDREIKHDKEKDKDTRQTTILSNQEAEIIKVKEPKKRSTVMNRYRRQ